MTDPRLHVSFVCRYNLARSPMAAAMFTEQLWRDGLPDAVRVTSCGTVAFGGAPADVRAVRTLVEHGYPAPVGHRSARVDDDHLGADLVIALGREHVEYLQRRGVDDDRIWYVEVGNPCATEDFEVAFERIAAAMPTLHRLVDERLTTKRLDAAVGWRFWVVRPGEDLLRNPVASGSWATAVEHAVCRRDPEHRPPADRCVCGVYCDRSWAAVTSRALAYFDQSRAWMSVASMSGQSAGYGPAYVAGRVRLHGAVPYREPRLPKFDDLGVEWRAASGEILELYVLAQSCDLQLGELLVNRYGVPVFAERSQT